MDDAYDFSVTSEQVRLRRELVEDGWTDRAIARSVRAGALTRVRRGAYVDSALLAGFDEVDMMRVRSRAVLKTAHSASVLSHQNSLAELNVPLWGVDLDVTHLTRTDGQPGRREAGIVHHRGMLAPEEWRIRHGLQVMEPARAAMEVALTNPPESGLVAVCGVLHLALASMEELEAAARRMLRWGNSLNARMVLARADSRLSNVAETRTWHLFFEQRIPRPEPQVEVHDTRGNLLGIVDFLWRERGVFLEFDGKIKYEQFRRPGETLDAYLMREKRRSEQICAATGWVCIRIGWADLATPINTARRIRALLDSRPGMGHVRQA